MSVADCKHCFKTVLPKADNSCPACGGSFDSPPTDKRAGKKVLWLSKGEILNPICVQCGNHTDENFSLQQSSLSRSQAFFGNLLNIRPNLGLAVLGLFRPELAAHGGYRMKREIPCCARCRAQNPPELYQADHQNLRLGVLVNEDILPRLTKRAS